MLPRLILLSFCRNKLTKFLNKGQTFSSHSCGCWKHEWCKSSLFNVQNSRIVFSLFFFFMFVHFITFSQGFALATLSVWIEYSNVEECFLSDTPKTSASSDGFLWISLPSNGCKSGSPGAKTYKKCTIFKVRCTPRHLRPYFMWIYPLRRKFLGNV